MKKKVIFTIIAGVMLCTCSLLITYAYLIAQDKAENYFIVGENTIEVSEEFKPPEKLKPNVQFTKKPVIKNTGNLPCFIRARADFSDSRAKEFCEDLDIDTANWEYNSSDGYYYYKSVVKPGNETTPLFTTIKIKNTATADDMIDFDVLVYAESVQHDSHGGNCPLDEYKTVWKKYLNK